MLGSREGRCGPWNAPAEQAHFWAEVWSSWGGQGQVESWWELLQGRSPGLEREAPVPGVALPCVTQDRFTPWGVSCSVTGGAWADPF